MQQRRLNIFPLFITITYAKQINFFHAEVNPEQYSAPITIYADSIEVRTDVIECPPPSCQCEVKSNATSNDKIHPVVFFEETPNISYVLFHNLQPNTLYSFTLTCAGTNETITRYIRTDYGIPSSPKNITVKLNSQRLTLFWSSPIQPAGPIYNYKLTIDAKLTINNIPNNQFSYTITEDFIYGERYLFYLQACNINRQNQSECSNPNDGNATFFMPMTTISTQETSTQENVSCILCSSKFFLILIFCFLLLN
ncbi:unnamed protein product [Rotaria sp. Silwood2]|nr:unnamed protein product [Rotaria sp. Silwood2]